MTIGQPCYGFGCLLTKPQCVLTVDSCALLLITPIFEKNLQKCQLPGILKRPW